MCFSDKATAVHVQFYIMQPMPDAASFPQEGKCLNTGTPSHTQSIVLCHLNHDHLHGLHLAVRGKRPKLRHKQDIQPLVEFTKEILLTLQENTHSATLRINNALSFSWARSA